ncbi:MAG: AarF/UbiB family protein, partial [Spirochaetes bacterium]|nr:AarF/UbiB family protein [Spirochaetota bacterium]
IEGIKISEFIKLKQAGFDTKKIAQNLVDALFKQIWDHGFFHADPHPGNIFALPGNTIAFIDLGMVGFLDEPMRDKMAELVISLNTRDHEGVARSLYNFKVFCASSSLIFSIAKPA